MTTAAGASTDIIGQTATVGQLQDLLELLRLHGADRPADREQQQQHLQPLQPTQPMGSYATFPPTARLHVPPPDILAAQAAEVAAQAPAYRATSTATAPEQPTEPIELYLTDEQVSAETEGDKNPHTQSLAQTLQCAICANVPLRYYMFGVPVAGALKHSYCASCLVLFFRQAAKSSIGTPNHPENPLATPILRRLYRASESDARKMAGDLQLHDVYLDIYYSKCPFTRTDVGPEVVVEDLRRDEEVEKVNVKCLFYNACFWEGPVSQYRSHVKNCEWADSDPAMLDPSHPLSSSSLLRSIIDSCTAPSPKKASPSRGRGRVSPVTATSRGAAAGPAAVSTGNGTAGASGLGARNPNTGSGNVTGPRATPLGFGQTPSVIVVGDNSNLQWLGGSPWPFGQQAPAGAESTSGGVPGQGAGPSRFGSTQGTPANVSAPTFSFGMTPNTAPTTNPAPPWAISGTRVPQGWSTTTQPNAAGGSSSWNYRTPG
ncbi:hypothetical protein M427DRAFT_28241 [Gonapodya prolifera JEL478]|uniref:Uncharacterized protein n=1 Tax=Gonapodya prolifera (strain JEL478) TaxID=1344416 RepID=A0A139AUZ0_GONPJ|nr:hypothetical protein M427DRAFT_28241 [Gonapodya prolifera JEL478]|eukprot:KXS20538.1 hypothetical protein M427DRAFT_28241 [Gonapodya prolifera JEL478]